MSNSKYSFWKLIDSYDIEIPMMQRDYAQGRKEDSITYVRSNIIASLESALKFDTPLDFDFIYGRFKENEQSNKKTTLIPIDGQQRLTTLFLLHWYLAIIDRVDQTTMNVLGSFSYATRTSSTEFCKKLVNHSCAISGDESISETIKDSAWFIASWELDPTVASMLVMLDAIHAKFSHTHGLFAKLTDEDNPKITFQYTPMPQLGLTNDVYIKMNSRGRALTEFENFKALFEQFLEKYHPTLKDNFAIKVDGSWTDFFWKHCKNDLIDEPFMNFFNFITKILYSTFAHENYA
ncbi:MAG: DUF262 domain-containing protein [Nitrospirae bacterium]|nr:DUF262 domain-containing protein [Nitrospirota bacterium]